MARRRRKVRARDRKAITNRIARAGRIRQLRKRKPTADDGPLTVREQSITERTMGS